MYDFDSHRAIITKRSDVCIVNLAVKSTKKVKSNRITNQNFKPSLKILLRTMKVILESSSIGKTSLSQEANINYHRLSKHLDWLKEKYLIEYVLEDYKVKIRLTEKGRQFEDSFRI